MTVRISRRAFGGLAAAGALATPAVPARAEGSQRAVYHLTRPSGWLCDIQRPLDVDGTYQLYYLHSDTTARDGEWHRASTVDGVEFAHHGTALPMVGNEPVWTGSTVRDVDGIAGFGPGAVIALATRLPRHELRMQQQYLYGSRDGGATFTMLPDPVIPNPNRPTASTPAEIDNAQWFRDPKLQWDPVRGEWVCVIGRQRYAAFYTSHDLRTWSLRRNFDYRLTAQDPDLGGIECPDLFTMTADDGTVHWVLGGSMDGWSAGAPMTFAYWIGHWDGEVFVPRDRTPQWLDRGFDWYSAVTWPHRDDPERVRLAIAWMNNWKYAAREVPTHATDGFNGQASIVRELRLRRQADGRYALISTPTAELDARVRRARTLPDRTVDGQALLEFAGRAYELSLDISWQALANVGVAVGVAADGGRRTNIGVCGDRVYVDRGGSDRPECSFGAFREASAPQDPTARSIRLRILVDRQSVEVFVNAGHVVLSDQVLFRDGDERIRLYTDGGPARFTGIRVREF